MRGLIGNNEVFKSLKSGLMRTNALRMPPQKNVFEPVRYVVDNFDKNPDPYFSNVTLLVAGSSITRNTSIIDESNYGHSLSLNNVTKSLEQTNFIEESSMKMNNSLIVVSSSQFNSYTVFTIELWVYYDPINNPSFHLAMFSTNESSGRTQIYTSSDRRIYTERYGTGQMHTSGVVMPSTVGWCHVVICRNSSNLYAYYVNGVRVSTTTRSESFGNSTGFRVSMGNNNTFFDEYRITRGVCRYNDPSYEIPTKRYPRS